jgi:hypothetical protein
MVDFKALKANRGSESLEKLTTEVKKMASNETKTSDDRFWQPTVDKVGNGYAVIRFLPAPGEEGVPFVRTFDHGFKGPGGWYIESSLTTLGKTDPVSEYNTKLWNASEDDNSWQRQQARKQKRRLHYISNIYVVNDPGNPENEGKVFLFKYGKKIFDKLKEAMEPQFEDETPMNPFDLWEGAPFKLKIRQVEGYRNYDKSEFGEVGPLDDDDKVMEKIWKSEHSLQEFLDPKNFKTYEELQARLNKVLAENVAVKNTSRAEDYDEDSAPAFKTSDPPFSTDDEDGDDESIKFFRDLAKS